MFFFAIVDVWRFSGAGLSALAGRPRFLVVGSGTSCEMDWGGDVERGVSLSPSGVWTTMDGGAMLAVDVVRDFLAG